MSATLSNRFNNRQRQLAGALSLVMCLIGASASAGEAATKGIVINANGFTHERGQAIANLFRQGDDVFKKPYLRAIAPIDHGKATLTFPNVTYGDYAIIVFHDENSNNDLDHNAFHFPAEPLGYSNGFKFTLFSGMPSVDKLRFTFSPDSKPLDISVN